MGSYKAAGQGLVWNLPDLSNTDIPVAMHLTDPGDKDQNQSRPLFSLFTAQYLRWDKDILARLHWSPAVTRILRDDLRQNAQLEPGNKARVHHRRIQLDCLLKKEKCHS